MGILENKLVESVKNVVRGESRAAVARALEDIATRIKSGDLLPNEAFAQFDSDQAELDAVYDKLPEG